MNNANHTIDTHYLLRQAARASDGTIDPLWRIASASDCLGANLNPDGTLTAEQIEAVRLFTQKKLVAIAPKSSELHYLEKLNFETAYAYFIGANKV